MSESKTEHVLRILQEHAKTHGGEAMSPGDVMAQTGASRNLVWTCTSTLRQMGVITGAKHGRTRIERDEAFGKIAEVHEAFGRVPHVGELKTMFSCSYATARKLLAEYAETLPEVIPPLPPRDE